MQPMLSCMFNHYAPVKSNKRKYPTMLTDVENWIADQKQKITKNAHGSDVSTTRNSEL